MIHLIARPKQSNSKAMKATCISMGLRTYSFFDGQSEIIVVFNVNEKERNDLEDVYSNCIIEEITTPYVLAHKKIKPFSTTIRVGKNCIIGGKMFTVIAGPCSIESGDQITRAALEIKTAGADVLRGGAYKPRSSPYSFQGMEEEGLILLKNAGDHVGLPVITEVVDPVDISVVTEYTDILQVGARNCQNYALLKKLGKINKAVLLKRGFSCTIEELLLSAEYIMSGGNMNVILCERGIRTFEKETRNTLDISAIPVLKKKTHLPVLVDPSHAAGSWDLIAPLSFAALACGCDGLIIEVHPYPENALSDGKQSLKPEKFKDLMKKLKAFSKSLAQFS